MKERCGKCSKCVRLEKVKRSVLRAVNPPFSHATDDTVTVWNDALEALPCFESYLVECAATDGYTDVDKWLAEEGAGNAVEFHGVDANELLDRSPELLPEIEKWSNEYAAEAYADYYTRRAESGWAD